MKQVVRAALSVRRSPPRAPGAGPPLRLITTLACALLAALLVFGCRARSAARPAPLTLERRILLAGVDGRIDHLALDAPGRRLFVAELGAGAVEAIDLAGGRRLGRIGGLPEPQGLAYLAARDELAVATGGDGMLRFYRAGDLRPVGSIRLGEDADNLRIDTPSGRLVVGYGKALAIVDPQARKVVETIPLPAHPEGFQILGSRLVVNLPGAGGVAVVDLASGRERARWRNPAARFNFPLAIDPEAGVAAVVYRLPARLVLFETASGRVAQRLETCGDADDVFFDAARRRLYVTCGAGAVEVFARSQGGYASLGRIATRSGARTGLFSPALDRLFVAERAGDGQSADVLVLRPQ